MYKTINRIIIDKKQFSHSGCFMFVRQSTKTKNGLCSFLVWHSLIRQLAVRQVEEKARSTTRQSTSGPRPFRGLLSKGPCSDNLMVQIWISNFRKIAGTYSVRRPSSPPGETLVTGNWSARQRPDKMELRVRELEVRECRRRQPVANLIKPLRS